MRTETERLLVVTSDPVQGEARAEALDEWWKRTAPNGPMPTRAQCWEAGWDAHTAHAAAEVEQLKAVEVKSGENLTGTGRVLSLWRGHNVIWSHAFHIDGPLDGYELMRGLMRAARLTEHGVEPR